MESPPLLPADPPDLTPKPVNRFRWWIHLVIIGGYPVLLTLFAIALGGRQARGPALSNSAAGLLAVCGIELVQFTCFFTLGWLASRANRDDLMLHWRPSWLVVPLGFVYSVGLRIGLLVLMLVVAAGLIASRVITAEQFKQLAASGRRAIDVTVDPAAMGYHSLYFWLSVTLVSFVVAGLREELWRAGLLAALAKLWPRWFAGSAGQFRAVAIGALIFGLAHWPQGIVGMILTTIMGLGLGAIMVTHRSIWPAVFAHGFFDATTLALVPLTINALKAAPN